MPVLTKVPALTKLLVLPKVLALPTLLVLPKASALTQVTISRLIPLLESRLALERVLSRRVQQKQERAWESFDRSL